MGWLQVHTEGTLTFAPGERTACIKVSLLLSESVFNRDAPSLARVSLMKARLLRG